MTSTEPREILVIGCGALAKEIEMLKQINGWQHLKLQCLDAELHNHPHKIPAKIKEKIDLYRDRYARIFVAYGDCGTGGGLDRLLEQEDIERLPGAHCYAFYAGVDAFDQIAEEELGTFYLTDFLVRHFDRLMVRGLKLDTQPELMQIYFAHYKRLLYLSQVLDDELIAQAEAAAAFLGFTFEHRHVGYGQLQTSLAEQAVRVIE